MKKKLLLCVCVMMSFFAFSSAPTFYFSSAPNKDTLVTENKLANKEARKAMLFSTVLPGLGQAYNHKYWKIPLIYGTAGGLGYLFMTNNKQYKSYSQALSYRYDNDVATMDDYANLSDANLVTLKKQYKRRRDLAAIGIGAVYLINIIDANVDAHLRKFDEKINEKITLSVRPCTNVMSTFGGQFYYSGLKLKLHF